MASGLSREEKTLLFTRLGEQLAGDFTPGEIHEIRRAGTEADAEFERGEGLSANQFYKKIGL